MIGVLVILAAAGFARYGEGFAVGAVLGLIAALILGHNIGRNHQRGADTLRFYRSRAR